MVDTATAQVYLNQNHERPELLKFAGGIVAVFSRRSPCKETDNEDSAVVVKTGKQAGVLAVADGCGGMSSGAHASRLAVAALQESLAKTADSDDGPRAAILNGIETANRNVRELGIGAATTLAAVEIDQAEIQPYHVGDSQILLVGNRGKIKLQTQCHAPVAYAVAAGVLSEEEAIYHQDRHLVSNVLGSADTHIEIGPRRTMSRRDTLLIASDGLFDNLLLGEIVQIIRKGPLAEAALALADLAGSRMQTDDADHPSKPDDLTFIAFRLG
jgi:serine/threonine protein phosphatase PrpC